MAVLLALPLMGQVRTGNIFGRVVDQEGNPLPGVSVTLTGSLTAPMTTITSSEVLSVFSPFHPPKITRLSWN